MGAIGDLGAFGFWLFSANKADTLFPKSGLQVKLDRSD